MIVVCFLGLLFALCVSVIFRTLVLHPVSSVCYAVKDSFLYFKERRYDYFDAGRLICYFAHFGGGKTLSVVHDVVSIFRRYNNKRVWDSGKRKFVLQKIHIISNAHLNGVPYEELCSLSQVVCCAWRNKKIDADNDTRTVLIVLLDEASSQLNSRNFKTNIDADFLNTLITSRHFHMSLFYTSQKFHLVDALLRSVTQTGIHCQKKWRVMVQTFYNADELEHASDPCLVKPIHRRGWFVKDSDYNSYDTFATVERLKHDVDANEMLSEKEILEMRGNMNPDNDSIVSSSRRLRRIRKKKR